MPWWVAVSPKEIPRYRVQGLGLFEGDYVFAFIWLNVWSALGDRMKYG